MRPILPSTRRSTIQSLMALLLPSGAFASEFFSSSADSTSVPDPVFFAQVQRFVRPALLDISAGRVLKGISSLEQARVLMAGADERNWACWFYINQPYGLALVRLGRYQDAIEPLRVALATEARMRVSSSFQFQRLVRGLDEGIVKQLLRAEYARQALSNVDTTGQAAHTIKELLLDQSTGTMDASELLVRAYAMSGHLDEAIALLEPQIQDAKGQQVGKEIPPVALEYRLIKMGAALSSAGDRVNASRAFDAALDLNFYRLRTVGENVASLDIQFAIHNVRRFTLSAALGNVDFPNLSVQQTRALLVRIVETKGLGVRYAERCNRLVGLLKGAEAEIARHKLRNIESQLSEIPTGAAGLLQLFELSNQRWKAISPVMPELQRSGLGDTFQDGESLLSQARAALGSGAMIGYMAYTPLASDKYEFQSPHYLRYCITQTEIQIVRVGLKTEIDKAVFKLRQHILLGQSPQQLGVKLSRLLLSDLPDSINDTGKWTIEPDGALNLLPFEVLPAPNGSPLISLIDIGYVSSFGQARNSKVPPPMRKARIIADPEFGNRTKSKKTSRVNSTRASVTVVHKGRSIETMVVSQLPETRIEAEAVKAALHKLGVQSELFLGRRADMHSFEMADSPRILHVATHGVLVEEPSLPQQSQADSLGQAEFINIALPGRNAGLVVAGAGKPELFYASDIAQLPLQDTELVVLSACDSGNGAVDVGEGVASLRRAVEAAGARASVTSLWAVPNKETTKLMRGFYGYLASGYSKRGALRQAKLDFMARDRNPYNWAGFVFAGQE